MKRMIYIPGIDRWVTLGQYVKAIKKVKSMPLDTIWPHSLEDWTSARGSDILREFMKGIMDRINQGIPYSQRGIHTAPVTA
ncbi:MAG: hypothetical protein E3J71_09480 [Candidatus Stahlbacteria bacterium]|nr:MAG: hypothetical protein E3J71_09480 [Candidatus Stahlbacteria bacterium]